ncbi:MAG: glycosyltransferase, partial [Nocardioides sp.]
GLRSRRLPDGSWLCVLRFARATAVAPVLVEVARQAVRRDLTGHHGLWAATEPPADDDEVPADVVLTETTASLPVHPVLGRAPVTVRPEGPDRLGPLDARVLSPIGFPLDPIGAPADLAADARLDRDLVDALRPVPSVQVGWPEAADPGLARTVAGLAMTGTVLTSATVPAWAADLLGAPVVEALTSPLVPADALAREEHSIVLRRAAQDTFSGPAWRRRTAARAGVRVAGDPAVSVVLATKRPEMVDFALSQVARQRGVALELVLAPHGFEVDEAAARTVLGEHSLVLRPQPDQALFGDVLQACVEASSGDVILKMDDDDWYAPDVVTDLLRARAYSGAEVVGMPAEVHYLTEPDLTVRRGHATELYARFVAGGTLMIDRPLLREVGGFRAVRRFVDAQLLAGVAAAGGTVYRTHGLGYVLRRNPTGHTWQVDLDYLLDPTRVRQRWDGFRPSRLLGLGDD